MSKSDSPNTLVISSSAVNVLIDLMMVVKDTITLMTMMPMMTMKMMVKMVLNLTYVSIWVSPMLALNRLSWSFACKCHRQYIQYINISQENTVSYYYSRYHLHDRKLFSGLHHSNVPLIQLPESHHNVNNISKKWPSDQLTALTNRGISKKQSM